MFLTTIIKSGSTVVHRGHRLAGSVRVPILAHWPLGWGGCITASPFDRATGNVAHLLPRADVEDTKSTAKAVENSVFVKDPSRPSSIEMVERDSA